AHRDLRRVQTASWSIQPPYAGPYGLTSPSRLSRIQVILRPSSPKDSIPQISRTRKHCWMLSRRTRDDLLRDARTGNCPAPTPWPVVLPCTPVQIRVGQGALGPPQGETHRHPARCPRPGWENVGMDWRDRDAPCPRLSSFTTGAPGNCAAKLLDLSHL